MQFQSTRPSQTSTLLQRMSSSMFRFQSTRPSQTSTWDDKARERGEEFQSTRPSQTSTFERLAEYSLDPISIHEAFADLDLSAPQHWGSTSNFNPRGLRRPRREAGRLGRKAKKISIHEAFADLDLWAGCAVLRTQ